VVAVGVTEEIMYVYVSIPTLPLITRLPTEKQRAKILKTRSRQWFGKYICQLMFCTNPFNEDGTIGNMRKK
jgi:hypothetical protein